MNKLDKIWVLENYDDCDGWCAMGYFSTEEKAKEYKQTILEEDGDIFDETSEFRIEWHYVDKGYFE